MLFIMLIPLPEPKDGEDITENEAYWGYGATAFALLERCDNDRCGKPAVNFILKSSPAFGMLLIGARCDSCDILLSPMSYIILTREEAVEFVTTYKILNS